MIIGCVKEIKSHEYRVGVTPDNVGEYVRHGHTFLVETGAGTGAGFSDGQYKIQGAKILDNKEAVWSGSDMIIKVKEPLPEEYPLMREGQILYTYLHLAANRKLTDALLESKTIGVAYETIEKNHGLPCLKPMSEIAGRLSIQEGAKYLEKPFGGRGVLLGGVPGTRQGKVVILGAGIVGMNALKVAVGMGANVTIMDIDLDKLTFLDDLYGNMIQTLYSTPDNISGELAAADLVIGAILIPGDATPKLVSKNHLKTMKPGAVMVDVAIDQGGCFETSVVTYHEKPVYLVDGILHYCVGNMPGAVPVTSTLALTNTTLKYGLALADKGLAGAIAKYPELSSGVNTYFGSCTNSKVASCFGFTVHSVEELSSSCS